MYFSAVIKGSSADALVKTLKLGFTPIKVHAVLEDKTVVILNTNTETESYHKLNTWINEDNPPFPSGALLHYRPLNSNEIKDLVKEELINGE